MSADDAVPANPAPTPADSTHQIRRRAIRGGSLFMVVRLGMQVVQWGTTLYVARLLFPRDYGVITAATVLLDFADLLAAAGMGRALVHKKDLTRSEQTQAFTVCLGLAGLLYGILWFAAEPVGADLGNADFPVFVRVLALVLWLVPIASVANALLERDLALGKQSAVHAVMVVLQSALVLGLAAQGYGYWALGAGMILARVVQAGLVWYASGWRPGLALPTRDVWKLLKYGITVSVGSMLWFVYSNADFVAIGNVLGQVPLGIYSFAFTLISLPVQKLTSNVNQVAFAAFCRLQDDRPRLRSWYLRLTVLLSVIAIPSLTGLALIADDAIPLLLGNQWREAVLSFQLLSPVGAMMVVAATVPPLLLALGRPDLNLRYTALCAIVYPPAFYGAALLDGVRGVCIAWLVLYPILAGSLIHFTRSITSVSLVDILAAHRQILVGDAAMIAAVLAVRLVMPWDSWESETLATAARLVFSVVIGAATYTLWILTFARSTVVADVLALVREIRG
jgi:O-antigen/teichoic acid export membrane protein